jgi:hypothetical protein
MSAAGVLDATALLATQEAHLCTGAACLAAEAVAVWMIWKGPPRMELKSHLVERCVIKAGN